MEQTDSVLDKARSTGKRVTEENVDDDHLDVLRSNQWCTYGGLSLDEKEKKTPFNIRSLYRITFHTRICSFAFVIKA